MSENLNLDNLLRWRCIGPFRGGRVVAVAGSYHDPNTFYFGACAGGVWKTNDGGTYWRPITDGFFTTSSVGALAVAPSDSNVIYAGTGETTIRIDVSHGDGVYKCTDAGRTWTHAGLKPTRHIGKIRVHPNDPDTRLGRRPRSRLRPQPRTRHLQIDRRRPNLAPHPPRLRQSRRRRSLVRDKPAHPLHLHLGGLSHFLDDLLRRTRQRSLAIDRRRRDLDQHHRPPRSAHRHSGARSAVAASPAKRRPRLGPDRARQGRRSLPLRRRGRQLGESHRQPKPPLPRLVLHPPHGRPASIPTRSMSTTSSSGKAPTAAKPSSKSRPPTATTTTSGSTRRTTAG